MRWIISLDTQTWQKKVLIGFKRTNLGCFTYIDKTILFQSIFEHLIKHIDGMFHFSWKFSWFSPFLPDRFIQYITAFTVTKKTQVFRTFDTASCCSWSFSDFGCKPRSLPHALIYSNTMSVKESQFWCLCEKKIHLNSKEG